MKKWYQENYVNRRDWLLENLELLNLTHREMLFILLVDYYNSNNIKLSSELFTKKLDLSDFELNKMLESLCIKGYLKIDTKKGLSFDISKVFETEKSVSNNDKNNDVDSIVSLFESEFNRPLSHNDIAKINHLITNYPKENIVKALQIAVAYKKVDTSYIETILKSNFK